MADLELTRTREDRRLYALGAVGTLRLEGMTGRRATAEAGAGCWNMARTGFWRRNIVATDQGGQTVGEFEPRAIRRGGALRWAGRELMLRPASATRWPTASARSCCSTARAGASGP